MAIWTGLEEFNAMAPADLLALIDSGTLPPARLTFAAESAGRLEDSDAVRRSLLPLLRRPEPLLREGVIYGLERHINAEVRAELERIAHEDPSCAVREVARDAIECAEESGEELER